VWVDPYYPRGALLMKPTNCCAEDLFPQKTCMALHTRGTLLRGKKAPRGTREP